ncbi:MAG: hypothetical protein KDE04_12235 [Anaerolineales bacterium]|nr:hypothetical protein [Anaerolineales bacterium]MCB0013444.1 hypothetical protein [Anaerolineales bacterium]MCB8960744.1 pesticidal protein Cry15Aa [Ardenticatenales bacterium]
MLVIKRYPNRKLYDTEAKKYITLDGIAQLIRDGQEVQILDHSTGEDLTTLTLTQIIFEQEKKKSGFLPRPVLTGLIQAGGDTLSSLRRNLMSPLDVLRHVDEEIRTRISSLIRTGEISEEQGGFLLQKLLESRRNNTTVEAPPEDEIERILSQRGVPSSEDMQQISEQLDALAAKLDELSGAHSNGEE